MMIINHLHFLKSITLEISLVAISCFAQGQTILPAEFNSNTVLTKNDSPYLIQGTTTIEVGAVLQLDAGVVIEFASNASITVKGKLIAQGTAEDSVYFIAQGVSPWQRINATSANIDLQYCSIRGSKMLLLASGGNNITIMHCTIESRATGSGEDCIAVHDAKKVYIAFIKLTGMGGTIAEGSKNDAIDLDHVDSCFVLNSIISNFSDDGVDIGTSSKYALISNNLISHCNYGVTVGETSTAFINNNIITQCDAGFQVHNGATINCNYNTLYFNRWGIECYHSEEGNTQTGGTAHVQNTIFSATIETEILTQTSSVVTISYSVSDRETLPGNHNLFGDPLLTDPGNGYFTLQSNSPCINKGSPDGEGNRTTMGAVQNGNPVSMADSRKRELEFYVYPNPTVDFVWIEPSQDSSARFLKLYNNQGNLLISRIILQNRDLIDLRLYPAGFYYLLLSSGQTTGNLIIIKK